MIEVSELADYRKHCLDLRKRAKYMNDYAKRNRDKVNRWAKNGRLRDKRNAVRRAAHKDDPREVSWGHARSRARRKGLPIDRIGWREVPPPPKTCPCCGVELSVGKADKSNSPSLDRIIPERGYVLSNIQWLCYRCNTIKQDATPEELMRLALYVAKKVEESK